MPRRGATSHFSGAAWRYALLVLLTLAWLPVQAECSRVLRVPFEDWRPFAYLDAAGKPTGMEIELLQAIAQEAGCQLSYQFDIPRKRRLLMFQNGDLDLLFAASDTAERRRYAWFTKPYRQEEIVAFALQGDKSALAVPSLDAALDAHVALIVPSSGWFGPYYAKLEARSRSSDLLTRYEDYSHALQLLLHGRGRILIGERFAVMAEAQANEVPILPILEPVNRDAVHFMLSRASLTEHDLAAFDRAIARLEKRGVLQNIRKRYLSELTSSR